MCCSLRILVGDTVICANGSRNSPHGVVSNVEIGLSNPNLASSRILQSFASTSGIVISPTSDQYVCSFMDHAKNQFPSFKEDVKKFGLPRNLATTKIATPLQLVTDADYDDGVVVGLPLANLSSIFVPFDNTIRPVTSTDNCEIQVDIARRDPCVHAASGVANDCGGPQTLNVQVYAGNTMSNTVSLKSRYSVEFAPYDVSSPLSYFDVDKLCGLIPCLSAYTPALCLSLANMGGRCCRQTTVYLTWRSCGLRGKPCH